MGAKSTVQAWPPDYVSVFAARQRRLAMMRQDPTLLYGAIEFYRTHPIEFIEDWVDTYDPRNAGKPNALVSMPFILFKRQRELITFLLDMIEIDENGLVEKCRDAGVTWLAAAISVWLWRFWDGTAIGWGSRKEQLVDRLGVIDSIFEKMRVIIRRLPREFWPVGFSPNDHMPYMRIINPETDSVITGEAGDNIGRGGRTRVYFKDESAHYERPEAIEAALSDNTRVQIDISSVNGLGNVFQRRREAGVDWFPGKAKKGKTNVFVFDWRDHPAKTEEWYKGRYQKAVDEGLLAVFKSEVDRDYAASVEGVIIPPEWVEAAVDAHIKLGIRPTGQRIAGLDVSDGGKDSNALVIRRDFLLEEADDWGDEKDVGATTRRSIGMLTGKGPVELQYDCIGVGAGVKAEANRLKEDGKLPPSIHFTPWNAGKGPLFPEEHVEPDDTDTPLNEDFYMNLKAQAWWQLRRRFERTFKAITQGEVYQPSELVSISSKIEKINRLKKELSQATFTKSTASLKLMVNKTPNGSKSPNMADGAVEAFWPVPSDETVARFIIRSGGR